MSNRAAFTCRLRKQEKHSGMEAKKVASQLLKSVMDFWHSAEVCPHPFSNAVTSCIFLLTLI